MHNECVAYIYQILEITIYTNQGEFLSADIPFCYESQWVTLVQLLWLKTTSVVAKIKIKGVQRIWPRDPWRMVEIKQ